MSNSFETILRKDQWKDLAEAREDEELITEIFTKHRDRLIAAYAAWMRRHAEVEQFNASMPSRYHRPFPDPSRQWCSAAILILTHGDEETQKRFLGLPIEKKDRLVKAVIDDGGMWHDGQHWQELPE